MVLIAAEVKRVFGEHMLDYILGLCKGNYDYISRISDPLQIYIISFLELEDIGHLAQTSKHFHKVNKHSKFCLIEMLPPLLKLA